MTQTNDPPLISSLELIPDYQSVIAQEAGGIETFATFNDLPPNENPPKLYYVQDTSTYYKSLGPLAGNFSFESMSYTGLDISANTDQSGGIDFSDDGTLMNVCSLDPDEVEVWELTTPFDISTASRLGNTGGFSNATGLRFNDDGSKGYLITSYQFEIKQYDLSTPYDFRSKSFDGNMSVSKVTRGMDWNDDGTLMLTANSNTFTTHEFSTPYDITTRTSQSNHNIGAVSITDLVFGPTGDKVFWDNNGNLEQWNLSTRYDITTATFAYDLPVQGGSGESGICFGDNGQKFFEASTNTNRIYEYEIPTSGGYQAF